MGYDTVIFDLDGTLLDTLSDLADSANYALAACSLPTRSREEIRAFVGNGVEQLIARSVPAGTASNLVAGCLDFFRAHYLINMEHKTAPYPGVVGLLGRLRQAGYRLAIVSNKFDGAVKVLTQNYFGALVPTAIGARAGVAKKPAPDTVFVALEELGADAAHSIYVGDSDVDIATAKNVGLPCIAVSWGFRDRNFLAAHGAERIADNAEELYRLLTE